MNVYLVCYDISDDRTRTRVHQALGAYGDPVQYSVFQVRLKSDNELRDLTQELRELGVVDEELRLYRLCDRCLANSHSLGGRPVDEHSSMVLV